MDSNIILKALTYAKDNQGWSHSFAVNGDEINENNYSENVEWLNGEDNAGVSIVVDECQISWSDLQPFITQAEQYFTSIAHKSLRARAYPSIADQLDMIFHAGLGGDEFQAAIQAVKDAYPKSE